MSTEPPGGYASPSIAVLGLGAMGGRAAAKLAADGLDVSGFDPAEAARRSAHANGVQVADDAGTAVADADLILLSLPGPPQVRSSTGGLARSATPGSVVVDMSTIDAGTARAAAATLAEHGIHYVDGPVLGRPDHCGRWTLPIGGDSDTVDRVRAALQGRIADRVVRVGEVGAGCTVKLLNNLMFGAINAVTAEALAICARAGVEQATFVDLVANSGAATVSPLFRELAAKVVAGDYQPTFEMRLLRKDNRLALQLAQATNTPAFMAAAVDTLNEAATARWPTEDTAAMVKLYQLLAGDDSA